MINHISICFQPHSMNIKENFFRAQAKKGISRHIDTSSVVWTLINNGKLLKNLTFLCLGISTITWVIILQQLFLSASRILVNIPLNFVSVNYQWAFLRSDYHFLHKYCITLCSNYSILTVRISFNSVLIFPTSFDSATVSDLNGRTGFLKLKRENIKLRYQSFYLTARDFDSRRVKYECHTNWCTLWMSRVLFRVQLSHLYYHLI